MSNGWFDRELYSSVGKGFLKYLLWVVCLIAIVWFFGLGFVGLIVLLCVWSLGFSLWQKSFKLLSWLKQCLIIMLLVSTYHYLGNYGILGWVAIIVLSAVYILGTRWKQFLAVKHKAETLLFGQPLYKYREQEKKPPRIKIKL